MTDSYSANRTIQEAYMQVVNEGIDRDNFRHFFGRLFGVRTDYLDVEDFIDDLIRKQKGQQPSSKFNQLQGKMGPYNKDTMTASELKEYIDGFPKSPIGSELYRKNKGRYQVFVNWLMGIYNQKKKVEDDKAAKDRLERIKKADDEKMSAFNRMADAGERLGQKDRNNTGAEGYSDFGHLNSQGQVMGY